MECTVMTLMNTAADNTDELQPQITQMTQIGASNTDLEFCDSREPTAGRRPAVAGFQPLGSLNICEICGCLFDRRQTTSLQ